MYLVRTFHESIWRTARRRRAVCVYGVLHVGCVRACVGVASCPTVTWATNIEPAFLDAWVQATSPPPGLLMLSGDGGGGEGGSDGGGGDSGGGEGGGEGRPLSALYRVRPTGEREWLSVRVS